jgi:pantoate--beta-alanine ligase
LEILRTASDLSYLAKWRGKGNLVLVPTMGSLHEGHLSLVRQAGELGPVVVTIFVNPTQFGPHEDFDSYPRNFEKDLALLEPLEVAAVFAPSVDEIYGTAGGVSILPGSRGLGLCGADRPGHFTGVLTVVAKLFGLVQPDVAIFGRKDAQQCLVLRQMVEDLFMPIRLVDGVTVREPDGLALSSRNQYLNDMQRQQALCLSQALHKGRSLLEQGERSCPVLVQAMVEELAQADALEYAEIRKVPNLEQCEIAKGVLLLAVSAQVGPARLIDNLVLECADSGVKDGFLLGPLHENN